MDILDDRISKEVWGGEIAVCFVLSEDSISLSTEKPQSYYCMLPRCSYFPIIFDKLRRHFDSFIDFTSGYELWLEYGRTPLKWHYPIGLLHDLYAYNKPLPWTVTVHFKDYPTEELLSLQGGRDFREPVEALFMASLKEADALKHRGDVMNSLQKRDHKQLWSALMNSKYDEFWEINIKLMDYSTNVYRNVPLRIHQVNGPPEQPLLKAEEDIRLMDVLESKFPTEAVSTDSHMLLCHGIEVPLSTPLLWLYVNMSYPDNFIHLAHVQRNS